mmetsp:Transcript_33218/g.98732  ORF Transcript_33218/g.98732 Transcript_33218/m.98732 type:complete len:313 (-) Transcript_33218:682-1620(-)
MSSPLRRLGSRQSHPSHIPSHVSGFERRRTIGGKLRPQYRTIVQLQSRIPWIDLRRQQRGWIPPGEFRHDVRAIDLYRGAGGRMGVESTVPAQSSIGAGVVLHRDQIQGIEILERIEGSEGDGGYSEGIGSGMRIETTRRVGFSQQSVPTSSIGRHDRGIESVVQFVLYALPLQSRIPQRSSRISLRDSGGRNQRLRIGVLHFPGPRRGQIERFVAPQDGPHAHRAAGSNRRGARHVRHVRERERGRVRVGAAPIRRLSGADAGGHGGVEGRTVDGRSYAELYRRGHRSQRRQLSVRGYAPPHLYVPLLPGR